MTAAALNLALSLAIVGAAMYIIFRHTRCPKRSPDLWMVNAVVLLLASLSLLTSLVPVFVELEVFEETFRFMAGVLRGMSLVLLLAYALRYRYMPC